MYGMYFSFVVFVLQFIATYYGGGIIVHFFTYTHDFVLFSINVFKRKKNYKKSCENI